MGEKGGWRERQTDQPIETEEGKAKRQRESCAAWGAFGPPGPDSGLAECCCNNMIPYLLELSEFALYLLSPKES